MKKILFGSAAAVCAALGFSSFTHADNGTYYWFTLSKDVLRSGALPTNLKNADINHGFYATTSLKTTFPAKASLCNGNNYYCVAGFTTIQLTAAHNYLKTSALLSQSPFTAIYTKQ